MAKKIFISGEKLRGIVESYGILELVSMYAREFNVKGNLVWFICPSHPDKNLGSTVAYIDKNDYYCWGCNKGGDIWTLAQEFIREKYGVTNYNDFLEALAGDLGIDPETIASDGTAKVFRIPDEVYETLFGDIGIEIEKDFTNVVLRGKSITVPTKTYVLRYSSLYIGNRELHDDIVVTKGISVYEKKIKEASVEEALKLKELFLTEVKKMVKAEAFDTFSEKINYHYGNKVFLESLKGGKE